jgi:CYTH domain-containing protein
MENLQNLSQAEKRKWLVKEMKEKWHLDEEDIMDGDCEDNAIVCGNADIKFIDIFKTINQLDWVGFEIGDMEIFIDVKIARNCIDEKCYLPTPDEFSIVGGIIRIWYD